MHVKRLSVAVSILFLWFWVSGCGKAPSNTATAPSTPTQTSSDQPGANAAAPAGSASNPVPPAGGSGVAAPANTVQTSAESLTIPAGTPVTIRLQQSLSSASAVRGEQFEAVLDEPVVVENRVVMPTGASVSGHVVSVHHSGRLRHPGELALTLDTVTVGDRQIGLTTSRVVARGRSHKKRNLSWIGGGTGGGALIGGLVGGGEGALIGGGIGAAAGTTTALITGKKDVVFGAERRLRFRLNRDVTLTT